MITINDESKILQLKKDHDELLQKIARLTAQARQKKSQASELERKARTRRLIEHGGLIEKLLTDHFDKGILVGIIAEYQDAFKPEKLSEYIGIKQKGDRLIAEWEAARKQKNKTEVEAAHDD